MQNILTLMSLIVFVLFFVGLIFPKKSLWWYWKEKTRILSAKIYGWSFILISLTTGALFPKPNDTDKSISQIEINPHVESIQNSPPTPAHTDAGNSGKTEQRVQYNADGERVGVFEQEIQSSKLREQVENQFSSWDGSHYRLIKAVKKAMNDPSSFEHIGTSHLIKEGFIYARMDYRGKNGFGALMKASVLGQIDPVSGEVVSLVDLDK